MRKFAKVRPIVPVVGLLAALILPGSARAGKVSWLDDVVRAAVREAEVGSRAAARAEGRSARTVGRLFARESEESLEALARRSDDLARLARRVDEPAEVALRTRFARLVGREPEMARTFASLAPAERRLVVEMGETAQKLARRYPGQAETIIRRLGTEGLSAVRAYGDDVAEVIIKEGPDSVNVLRKTGRSGWKIYTGTVLRHKKSLAAAGVLALFLADPDRFVDSAGRVTEYAVQQFARAGVKLAGAVGGGATRGLESAIGAALRPYGIDSAAARKVGIGMAALVAILAALVLIGLPIGWIFRPLTWPFRVIRNRARAAKAA